MVDFVSGSARPPDTPFTPNMLSLLRAPCQYSDLRTSNLLALHGGSGGLIQAKSLGVIWGDAALQRAVQAWEAAVYTVSRRGAKGGFVGEAGDGKEGAGEGEGGRGVVEKGGEAGEGREGGSKWGARKG